MIRFPKQLKSNLDLKVDKEQNKTQNELSNKVHSFSIKNWIFLYLTKGDLISDLYLIHLQKNVANHYPKH